MTRAATNIAARNLASTFVLQIALAVLYAHERQRFGLALRLRVQRQGRGAYREERWRVTIERLSGGHVLVHCRFYRSGLSNVNWQPVDIDVHLMDENGGRAFRCEIDGDAAHRHVVVTPRG